MQAATARPGWMASGRGASMRTDVPPNVGRAEEVPMPCPLCVRDGRRMSTVAEIGDPSSYCTVYQHRELAVQAIAVATWNAAMWEPAPTPDVPEPVEVPADQQGALL